MAGFRFNSFFLLRPLVESASFLGIGKAEPQANAFFNTPGISFRCSRAGWAMRLFIHKDTTGPGRGCSRQNGAGKAKAARTRDKTIANNSSLVKQEQHGSH